LFLGDVEYGEKRYYYYALVTSDKTRYFEVKEERFYHDGIHEIDASNVPEFLLARLGGE